MLKCTPLDPELRSIFPENFAQANKSSLFIGVAPDRLFRICNQAHHLGLPPLWEIPTVISMRAPQLPTKIKSSPISKLQDL